MKILYSIILFLLVGNLTGQTLTAVNDTIDLVPGIPKTVYLLANDTIPAGDSLRIIGGTSFSPSMISTPWKNKGWFTYVAPHWGFNGKVVATYTVVDVTLQQSSSAKVVIRIRDRSYDSLAVNNIDAWFNASGLNFWLPFADLIGAKGFIVPKGSGKKTIWSNSIWIGGQDHDSNLYVAGERYRQGNQNVPGIKQDYYAGPVMDSANYSIYQDTIWNYIWNLKKTDIEYHKLHWQDAGYHPLHNILTWPGNGDVNLGEAAQLAPYSDRNQDGIYNPMDGDFPLIRGDQALYFIFNENRGPHEESGGQLTMKAEFHAMAYAWDMPGDSAFNNTLFLNYKVHNRSQQTYYNTYLGMFTDIDLGYSIDDFIGCDVYRGSYYGYNGKAIDGNGQPTAYGAHPPAQSVTILAGPKMEPAGTDRPRFDESGHQLCNGSINGTGFGDGIPDNERMGLNSFQWLSYQFPGSPSYMNDPDNPQGYYDYLRSMWMDSTHMIYGGLGHEGYGGYGPQCRYMFPGESDTLNWGSGCVPPNGQKNWTELTAGRTPGDRRGFGSVGPFTFHPGDMKELDLAFVFARDYTSSDTLASVTKLRQMIDTVRIAFMTNKLPGGGSFTMVPELAEKKLLTCNIYPNPAVSQIHIDFETPLTERITLLLLDCQGRIIRSQKLGTGLVETALDLSGLSQGFYLLVIQSSQMRTTKKLSVIR
jgi:hypothetical protein